MTSGDYASGPLDVATLETTAHRASTHPVVENWAFEPDSVSPRRLDLYLDASQYPAAVTDVRLDVRWFETGDYTFHYTETHGETRWACRWDRHPKPDGPRAHFHPPPDAGTAIASSPIDETHHLGVLFTVLDRVNDRLETLQDG